MLYLAEVQHHKQGFLGGLTTEFILLACQRDFYHWTVLPQREIIVADEAKDFENGVLVLINLNPNRKIREKPEPAVNQLIQCLQKYSISQEQFNNQQEKIEQWKQSLGYQAQELSRREMELEMRLGYIEQREEELQHLEQRLNLEGLNLPAKLIPLSPPPIGKILQAADLVSSAQIEVVVKNQSHYPGLRLGEILALRGWINLKTVDFFVNQWQSLLNQQLKQPLGYYFKQAGLLDEEQIETILSEQKQLQLPLGAIAVLKGWLKSTTLEFFLEHLYPEGLTAIGSHNFVTANARASRTLLLTN